MFTTKHIFGLFIATILIISSCKKDEKPDVVPSFAKGFYIVNEGGFLQGNATLSFYDAEKDSMYNDVFDNINGRPLGDVFQSMTYYRGKGYLVVNNSQKIEVVDSTTLVSIATITGLGSPRGIYFFEEKAYITDLYSKSISVYNVNTLSKVKDIFVDGTTEKMLVHKDTLYATLQQITYDTNSKKGIIAIDPKSDLVVKYLELREGAYDMLIDGSYALWVICAGDFSNSINGAIYRIGANDFSILNEFPLTTQSYFGNALKLSPNGLNIYFALPDPSGGFTENDIYRMNIFSSTLPTTPLYNGAGKYIYGYGFNELYGELYILDAIGGGQKGNMVRADINTGEDLATYEVGYFPNNIVFK